MTEVTYYYDNVDYNYGGWTDIANMVDGSLSTYAVGTGYGGAGLIGSTCPGTDLGTISKVEVRFYGYASSAGTFADSTWGWYWDVSTSPGWTTYYDVTADLVSYEYLTWSALSTLVSFGLEYPMEATTYYIAKIELRVTYTASEGVAYVPRQGFILYQDPGMA